MWLGIFQQKPSPSFKTCAFVKTPNSIVFILYVLSFLFCYLHNITPFNLYKSAKCKSFYKCRMYYILWFFHKFGLLI